MDAVFFSYSSFITCNDPSPFPLLLSCLCSCRMCFIALWIPTPDSQASAAWVPPTPCVQYALSFPLGHGLEYFLSHAWSEKSLRFCFAE